MLIAMALPLRHADLFIVCCRGYSWLPALRMPAFYQLQQSRQRSLPWLAGVMVLFAMWLYFALKILLLF